MKPLLITTPRCGSTLIAEKLSNIAIDNFNYIKNLNEYFNIVNLVKSNYFLKNNIIQKDTAIRVYKNWAVDKFKIQLERLEILKINPNYMIKLFPFDIHSDVENYIVNTYDLIFLERKNKVQQFLSFLGLFNGPKQAHNHNGNRYTIDQLYYNPKILNDFLYILNCYKIFKSKYFTGKILYYEDLENNISELEICKTLSLNVNYIQNRCNIFDKTEYTSDPEDLIVNKNEWLRDRKKLENNLVN